MHENATKPVGAIIRQLRLEQKKSIQELADAIQVSASFLSRVERDKVVPSMYVLRKIALELKTRTILLMQAEPSPDRIYFSQENPRQIETREHMTIEHLTPGAVDEPERRNLSMLRLTLEKKPGQPQAVTHPFPALYIVLSGRVRCDTDMQSYQIEEGDSIAIDRNAPHWLTPDGTKSARLLLILDHTSYL